MNEIEVMEMAIAKEKEANKIYNDAATNTTDPNSKQLLLWLAREEMGHVIFLEVSIHSMKNKGEWPSKYSTAADNLLSKQLEKAEIPATSESGNKPKTDIPELEILKNAIEAEKEAEIFYQNQAHHTDSYDGKALLIRLAQIEKGHQLLLEKEYNSLQKTGSTFIINRFLIPMQH